MEHMRNRPDITIALVTWNREKFLRKGLPALFNALSNDMTHEILFWDNASSDGTLALLRQYESRSDVRIIANDRDIRYKAFNKLFGQARGRYIIEIDDDVIEFPKGFDRIAVDYMETFSDYGYLAFDTIVNELTDGNRGTYHTVDERVSKVDGKKMVVEEGESRGYLAVFRRRDYRLIRPLTFFFPFSINHPQDWVISGLVRRVLGKRNGVIRGIRCLHACGPLYARLFDRTEWDLKNLEQQQALDRIEIYKKKLD